MKSQLLESIGLGNIDIAYILIGLLILILILFILLINLVIVIFQILYLIQSQIFRGKRMVTQFVYMPLRIIRNFINGSNLNVLGIVS